MTIPVGKQRLTFNHEGSAAHATSCCVVQFARVGSCVRSLKLFDFHRHTIVLLDEFVFYTTRDFGPVFLPFHRDWEGTRYFATYLNKGAQNLLRVYQRFDEARGNYLLCYQKNNKKVIKRCSTCHCVPQEYVLHTNLVRSL